MSRDLEILEGRRKLQLRSITKSWNDHGLQESTTHDPLGFLTISQNQSIQREVKGQQIGEMAHEDDERP